MVTLGRMTDAEFQSFLDCSIQRLAAHMVMGREWPTTSSIEKSSSWHSALLRRGLGTPDHYLYTIKSDSASVGHIWLEAVGYPVREVGYIHHIYVDETFRRRRIGSLAIGLLGHEAYALGLLCLALHLFISDVAAWRFFRTVGFADASIKGKRVKMTKYLWQSS